MKIIDLSRFGPIVSSKSAGEEIYNLIKENIKDNETLTIDLGLIKSMATFCAKQIFGQLYLDLGSQKFFDKIILKNADDDLKTIIQIGIQHALEDKKN